MIAASGCGIRMVMEASSEGFEFITANQAYLARLEQAAKHSQLLRRIRAITNDITRPLWWLVRSLHAVPEEHAKSRPKTNSPSLKRRAHAMNKLTLSALVVIASAS